jgi:hypothetical protein
MVIRREAAGVISSRSGGHTWFWPRRLGWRTVAETKEPDPMDRVLQDRNEAMPRLSSVNL